MEERFEPLDIWGIQNQEKKAVWLPKGIVIPTITQNLPMKIKIRRSERTVEENLPKYVEVLGSRKTPSLFGTGERGLMMVESELDAMLLAQFAGELCTFMAIGSTRRKPDVQAHNLMLSFDRLLFSLDYDEPGKRAYKFWKKLYPHLIPWPSPKAKSAGDAFKLGIDLKQWVIRGLNLGAQYS